MKKCLFSSDLSYRLLKTRFCNLIYFLGFFFSFSYTAKFRPWKSKFFDPKLGFSWRKKCFRMILRKLDFFYFYSFFFIHQNTKKKFRWTTSRFFFSYFRRPNRFASNTKMLQIVQIFIYIFFGPKMSSRGRFRF